MSERAALVSMIDTLSDAQVSFVAAYIRGLKAEAEDDAFCERLAAEYDASPDKGDPVPLDDFVKSLGFTADEIRNPH